MTTWSALWLTNTVVYNTKRTSPEHALVDWVRGSVRVRYIRIVRSDPQP